MILNVLPTLFLDSGWAFAVWSRHDLFLINSSELGFETWQLKIERKKIIDKSSNLILSMNSVDEYQFWV